MSQQINDRGVEIRSEKLAGKRIALGVCGGIAAVEVVKIIRELRRHGARVIPHLTPSVKDFVTDLTLEWAAGEKAIQILGPEVEHLEPHDLVLVAPLTLNTLTKSALGMADNPVTLLIASQIGTKAPLLFIPTMNRQLSNHPRYREYVVRLQEWGVVFLESDMDEDRLKMPTPERVLEAVLKVLL